MEWLWTWSGRSFGYRIGNSLFTQKGREVGRFHGTDVYGCNGAYLGELRNSNRLITALAKKGRRGMSFAPRKHRGHTERVDHAAFVMPPGCEDFPGPETFE